MISAFCPDCGAAFYPTDRSCFDCGASRHWRATNPADESTVLEAVGPGDDAFVRGNHVWDGKRWWTPSHRFFWDGSGWRLHWAVALMLGG